MKKNSFHFTTLLILSTLSGCTHVHQYNMNEKPPTNIIFMIGDGMGLATVTAARIWKKSSHFPLEMDTMPVTGLVRTYSTDDFTTDSAAGATAYSTGVKTFNGALGIDKNSKKLETVVDRAKKYGMSVGIITTTTITHATPSAYYAHIEERFKESAIAEQLIAANEIDLIFGGGAKYFTQDMLNPFLNNKGKFITKKSEMLALADDENALNNRIIGTFDAGNIPFVIERKDTSIPSLPEMFTAAIKILSKNPKGYFLLVEGGRIDHAAHGNLFKAQMGETLEFDTTIGLAKKTPNTLVVVTADHETGGMAVSGYGNDDTIVGKKLSEVLPEFKRSPISYATGPGFHCRQVNNIDHWATHPINDPPPPCDDGKFSAQGAHTAVDVPLYAMGPCSFGFTGVHENNDVGKKIFRVIDAVQNGVKCPE